ncbi:folate-binding protein [Actinomyces timonensis]|uniref:Folate-binding protein n=1 Tax=Actinomyces timonensis TaxID=1288391 RepID=A0AAU8N5L3_9ACTO
MRRSPLLDWPDAIAEDATSPDAAVPAHYGNPLREQTALVDGQAITALARDVVAVSGPDRLSWLTTLTSQALTSLTPGDGGAEALVLDAQGRIRHALAVLDDGVTAWIVVDAGRGPALVEHLERMRFTLRVEVSPRDDVAALGAMGRGATALEEAVRATRPGGDEPVTEPDAPATALPGAPLTWRDPWPGVVDGGTSYDVGLESSRHPGEGYRAAMVLAPAGRVPDIARSFLAGGPARRLAGALAWEALRVEAGRPRWAREADERAIPHELDWLRTAVHLDKGCYPGQETVARTLNLGRPPRRLTLLQLDGLTGQAPLPGAPVRLGERVVGAVTSAARHHELGPIALALLRRGAPADAALLVDVGEAGDAGKSAARRPQWSSARWTPLRSPWSAPRGGRRPAPPNGRARRCGPRAAASGSATADRPAAWPADRAPRDRWRAARRWRPGRC